MTAALHKADATSALQTQGKILPVYYFFLKFNFLFVHGSITVPHLQLPELKHGRALKTRGDISEKQH